MASIFSPPSSAKSFVASQHQRVYAAMGDRMKAEVHALSMKTYTPEKWAQLNGGDLVNNG